MLKLGQKSAATAAILNFLNIQINGHHHRMTLNHHTKYENDPPYGLGDTAWNGQTNKQTNKQTDGRTD